MDSHMMITGEMGILVSMSSGERRVEKGGQYLRDDSPTALSVKAAASGASLLPWLVVTKVWGDPLKDTRLIMQVADDDLINMVNN